MVAFEVKSWGAPVSSWRITLQGGGSWTDVVHEEGAPLHEYAAVWHEIEPQAENYIKLEALLSKLPSVAPDSDDCQNFMNDMP